MKLTIEKKLRLALGVVFAITITSVTAAQDTVTASL
jgi:hypothetical protein